MIGSSQTVRLIPHSALLTFAEQHLVSKFKYEIRIIGGKRHSYGKTRWVPEDSVVLRDRESGSIIRIP